MGGSGGGGGGGSREDRCPRLMFVVLADADVASVAVGSAVEIAVQGEAVVVISANGAIVGTVSPAPGVARLRECLNNGVVYEGLIESIEADAVRVQVTRW